MDVNASSLNMDNWENNDTFLVIVNEEDVLSMPVEDSNTQTVETIIFTEKHDISLTKDSVDTTIKEQHVTQVDQCFTLPEPHVAHSDPSSEMNPMNQDHMFGENVNIQISVDDNTTKEPVPSVDEAVDGTNIGDGIDILAEASLGLLSENILNKESVNQIKNIVASTIANFTPTSDNYRATKTEMIIPATEHGDTPVEISTKTSESVIPLFENTFSPTSENYTTRTEMVTPTSEADNTNTTIEIITQTSTGTTVNESPETTTETIQTIHPSAEELVIPVTLAEVNRMLNDNILVENPLDEDNLNEDSVHQIPEPQTSPNPEESRALDNNYAVLCDENVQIIETVEINMESSSQSSEVLFESTVSANQVPVLENTELYYRCDEEPVEEGESQQEIIVLETSTASVAELDLVSTPESSVSRPRPLGELNPVIDLQTSVDALSVSLADPIDLIRGRRSSKEMVVDDSVSTIQTNEGDHALPKPISEPVKQAQQSSSAQGIASAGPSHKVIHLIPSRVMGRSVDNPLGDAGRNMQKMRPGVKIPNRNLTSQIVSTDEIAKEIYAQALKKTPVRDLPQGGDLFYSRNLTKRLASRIVPSASSSSIGNYSKQTQSQADVHNVLPDILHNAGGIPDSDDLLAILEGDVDEWSIDRPPPQLIEAVTSPITARSSPPKLDPPIETSTEPLSERKMDPLLERELALKQLNSLDSHGRSKKDSPTKTRRKSKIQVKVDFDEVLVEEDGIPVGLVVDLNQKKAETKKPGKKRKADSESAMSGKTSSVAITKKQNGESVTVETKKTDNSTVKKRKTVHESEFASKKKTMKSPELTNGKLNSKSERPATSHGDKVQKAVTTAEKSKRPAANNNNDVKKESSVDKKMKPPDNHADKSKPTKKRKIEETSSVEEFVGPISRNMPPPPRTYSSRIKRSPMFTDFIVGLPSTSKNKSISIPSSSKSKIISIVPSDNLATKKEQKQIIKSPRMKSPTKVAAKPTPSPKKSPQTAKAVITSPKKRASESGKNLMKGKTLPKKLSEVDRLLMDEGAINMLYSVEQDEENRRSGATGETSSKKKMLKSTRRSQKDLLMKTRLVKNAVLRLTHSPEASQPTIYLRGKRTPGPPLLKKPQSVHERKVSQDSNDSHRSPPPLTPFGLSSPTQVFTYPPRLHLPAEASRIIRRHSSSSNFSSRSTSPNPLRRLSVEAASPQSNTAENISNKQTFSSAANTTHKHARKRGVPIFIKKQETSQTYKGKKKKVSTHSSPATDATSKTQDSQEPKDTQKSSPAVTKKYTPGVKTKLKAQLSKNFQKVTKGKVSTPPATKGKRTLSTDKGRVKDEVQDDDIPDLTACLAQAVTAFISEDEHSEGPASPSSMNQSRLSDSKKGSPLSLNAASYNNLIKTLETDSQKRQDGEDSGKERSSVRQSVGSFHYKELSLRRYDTMVQVILTPSSTKVKNALSLQVLRELRDVLNQLRKDDTCRAVLVTSTGSSFCQGLDFHSLINDKPDRRKSAAQELALAVTQFMTSLAHFNKLIIAGVHGDAVGLGVTMLPFFDMVFASDKATFYTPYARLGQIPEGAAVITLPHMLGNAVTSELLFGCRKLTASEALHYGLVTRILWPDRFQEELLPIIRSLANQSAQSMEATKALLRHSLRSKLDSALESESHLLVQHWTSSECQNNFKRFLDDEDVGPQRQRVDA